MTPPAGDNISDVAEQPVRPLRSALRSTDPKVTRNGVPSKSEKDQPATPATEKSGRGDRNDAASDLSGESGQDDGAAVETRGGGGTTLLDLKRQRVQSRLMSDTSPAPQPSAVKSTPSSVGNGDVSRGDHEPRLRLTSPEYITVEEKRERGCCVII